jgi:phosphatidylserine/phosphatidylglycerophosphate/cardiolipin synthase-like enzyme/regulation of enolase protein 1 (concanavalin A-like superfamily)
VAALCAWIVAGVGVASAQTDTLCDAAFQDCRTPLINLIRAETERIDVSFWFMEDGRYANEIIKRWQAGVPVRVMVDSRANAEYPLNAQMLQQLKDAGVPMREKYTGGILHRKFMLFSGQGQLEFSGANYSPDAFVPVQPYTAYVDEAIYFTSDPSVVNSFRTVMDDMWTNTNGYRDYANVVSPTSRAYPVYPIDPELNFPPEDEGYATRALRAYAGETTANGGAIDVQMYRITDRRHSDAMIDAFVNRHIPVRLYTDQTEYRNVSRLWHAWNVDRMWLAGIPIKVPAHQGINHQKTILLYGQKMTIFGSSNWTSPSDDSQAEHNYFTTKTAFFQWFEDQFNRKWNNTNPTGVPETEWFVPQPPDRPSYRSIANGATNVPTTAQKLVWYGGPWAHIYDVYFGTDPNAMTLFAGDLALGPSLNSTQTQSFSLPALQPGITYYWRIVSKTAALKTATGPIWSFTTGGTASCSGSSAPDVVMWMSNVPASGLHGNWTRVSDGSAGGGAALQNTDHNAAKITPALASPTNYVEQTFTAQAGTAYHLWVRMRAQGDSTANDSIHVQFSDSRDAAGSATMRIGTTSSAEVVLQDGDNGGAPQGYGWADNGWNTMGANIYFATTGTHTIRIQQREDGAIVDEVVLSASNYLCGPPGSRLADVTILPNTDSGDGGNPPPPPSLPAPWQDGDIGATPIPGSASYSSGTFTIKGSGADIWGTSDAFHFVYQQIAGDVTIQARVNSITPADRWSKAGVMIRASLSPQSAHALMLVSSAKGVAMQWRPTTGGSSLNAAGSLSAPPRWVRLVRNGNTISGYESSNGSTWTLVTSQTIAMGSTVYVGLAVTSHTTAAATTAAVANVSVTASGGGSTALPDGWSQQDIGAVSPAGSGIYSNGTYQISAAGADIWGTSDAFHYVYRQLTGDGSIVARVASVTAAHAWSKAGVMIRASLSADSAHANMLASAGKGTALQYRPATGADSLNITGPSVSPPTWIRLDRSGNTLTAYQSANGTSWVQVGSVSISMPSTVYVGIAVTSHNTSASTTATVDSVTVTGQ